MVTLLTCVAFSAGAATLGRRTERKSRCVSSDTFENRDGWTGDDTFPWDTLKIAATTARDASCPSSDAGIKSYNFLIDQFALKVNVKIDNETKVRFKRTA